MKNGRHHFDDLAVGQRFTSGSHLITREEVLRFAGEYDVQPFHLDDEAARSTLFGRLAASGWHTAAVSMRLLTAGGGLPLVPGIIGSGGELHWPRPVYPDDTLTVETEILDLTPSRSKPDRGVALVRCLTRNQNGETVQSFTPKLVVAKASSDA